MGRTTTEGRINSAAVWSTDRSREQEEGRKAKFGPSLLFPIISSLPPPNPFVFSSLPLHLLGSMLYMTFAKLEYSWSHYLLSAFCD